MKTHAVESSLKNNLLLQYTLITLGITLAVSLVVGNFFAEQSKKSLIDTHIDMYPVYINHMADLGGEISEFLASPPGTDPPPGIRKHLETLLAIDSVFRVKIWNMDRTVIWSDLPELAGKQFVKNDTLEKAYQGSLAFEITKPEKEEHQFEQHEGILLEIYIPLYSGGKIAGVAEIYESDAELNEKVARITRFNWIIIIFAGFTLYFMLFFIFYRSYKKQKQITEQVKQTEQVTIYALAYQAGLRDEETGRHLNRVVEYVRLLAEELRRNREYNKYVTSEYIEDLTRSAPLHDIGKVGVPDAILRKPGKLTDEEYKLIQTHCDLGAKIIEEAQGQLTFRSFLDIAVQIVRYHHEKWNGTGYPAGLKETDIPLSGRIMALADVYDALRSKRYYKEAFPHEKSVVIIREERGKHFDPAIVDAFLEHSDEFREISERLTD